MSAFPTVKSPRSLKIRSYTPTIVSRAHSGRTLVQSVNAQRWLIEAEWPPLTRDQAHEILAFLVGLAGQYGVFEFTPPNTATPRGAGESAIAGDDITVYAGYAAGYSSFWLKGWDPSTTHVLRKGDLIRFAGHAKTYMVAADLNSNASGYSNVQIVPPLMAAVVTDEVVTVYNVPISCRLTIDDPGMSVDLLMHYGLTLPMEEAW